MANVRLARWDWVQDGCPSVLARGRHHSLLLLASVLLLSTVSRGLLVPGGSLLGSALPGKDEAGRQSEQGQWQRPPRSHPRHCAEYLARGPSLPLRGGGKNNNVLAKKVGAAGSAFISAKKKALFPASPQRLFITHTRVWRKCSICWVQPSAHTAYKLRAFTCRVPEIKHTHTHTQKREELWSGPGALASPSLSLRPGPGRRWLSFRNSTLSPSVSSFLSREQLCFCLPAATSGTCYTRVSAVRARRLACAPPAAALALPSPESCGASSSLPPPLGEALGGLL